MNFDFPISMTSPYRDALDQGLLPCTMSLFDTEQRFRGVELTLETMPVTSGVNETLLLDQQGRVLVRSSRRESTITKNDRLQLPPFSTADTVRTVVDRGSGYMVSEEDGLVVFDRLGSVGWFYVVTGDADVMMSLGD